MAKGIGHSALYLVFLAFAYLVSDAKSKADTPNSKSDDSQVQSLVSSGDVWPDNDGKAVQAHGGVVLRGSSHQIENIICSARWSTK